MTSYRPIQIKYADETAISKEFRHAYSGIEGLLKQITELEKTVVTLESRIENLESS